MPATKNTPQRETLTVLEAAKRLGVGTNAVYNAAKAGELPCIRVGSRVLIPRHALDKMIGPVTDVFS